MWCGGEAGAPCFPGNDGPVVVGVGGGWVSRSERLGRWEENVSGDVQVGDFPASRAIGPELYGQQTVFAARIEQRPGLQRRRR